VNLDLSGRVVLRRTVIMIDVVYLTEAAQSKD